MLELSERIIAPMHLYWRVFAMWWELRKYNTSDHCECMIFFLLELAPWLFSSSRIVLEFIFSRHSKWPHSEMKQSYVSFQRGKEDILCLAQHVILTEESVLGYIMRIYTGVKGQIWIIKYVIWATGDSLMLEMEWIPGIDIDISQILRSILYWVLTSRARVVPRGVFQ